MSTKKLTEFLHLSERLAWLRQQLDLTQDEFGRRVGVSKSYISRLESDKRVTPSDMVLRRCSQEFGVPIEWLEQGRGQLPVVDPGNKVSAVNPGGEQKAAARGTLEQDITALLRILLEAVELTADQMSDFTGRLSETPDLDDGFKRVAVFAAIAAFRDRQARRHKLGGGK